MTVRPARARPQGPSPLTRGSPACRHDRRGRQGSIPAHAGQPSPAAVSSSRMRVHPRSRGAATENFDSALSGEGPSPLTRGSPGCHDSILGCVGSIPAHAGQPKPSTFPARECRVHPRSRGAADPAERKVVRFLGPSPLTRGSPLIVQIDIIGAGSIPAHAGQPTGKDRAGHSHRVHPRSRGAARWQITRRQPRKGPSPLTRGSRGHGCRET